VPSATDPSSAKEASSTRQLERPQSLALLLRAGTSIVVWVFCFVAFLAGNIPALNMKGVSIACAFIIMTCLPSIFIMRRATRGRPVVVFSTVDRLFVILGYTGIIYSMGGIEAAYLIPLYVLFIMYIGIASSPRMPYATAIHSIVFFTLMVVGTHYGVLPSLWLYDSVHLAWHHQLGILGATAGFLVVSAFISTSTARLIEEGRARLSEQNAELERARNRAQESDRMKSEFLANMSHELRTPLNHVIGFTELVLEDGARRLDETHRESLGEVRASAEHLLSLINDILDMAKVEAGKVELVRSDVDLTSLLQHGLAVVKLRATKRGVVISADLDDIPKRAWVDERRILQVLLNLLDNAVKFSNPGGRVLLCARECAPGTLEVSVSDSGVGIRPEDRERIFLPFERARGEVGARFPGTGLGLSIVRRLVELHGGRIWAESEGEGNGATFRFTLPVKLHAEGSASPAPLQ
jgi:signal transduction histidine kinase